MQAIRGAHLAWAPHPARRHGRHCRARADQRIARRLAIGPRAARLCGALLLPNKGHRQAMAEPHLPARNKPPMSTRQDSIPSPTVCSREELIAFLAQGSKPAAQWRIGTEHEKFLFNTDTLQPVPYAGPRGVRALMEGLISRFGWRPILEGDNIIGLKRPEGEPGGTISLEPGGQFELSGAPLMSVHKIGEETREHLDQAIAAGGPLHIGFLGVGFSPNWTLAETPVMPKQRYAIMRRYMPLVGSRGLDMMFRTSTIQVNLDFGDEADMVKKFRVALALQPIATAIFACSPFRQGKPIS